MHKAATAIQSARLPTKDGLDDCWERLSGGEVAVASLAFAAERARRSLAGWRHAGASVCVAIDWPSCYEERGQSGRQSGEGGSGRWWRSVEMQSGVMGSDGQRIC